MANESEIEDDSYEYSNLESSSFASQAFSSSSSTTASSVGSTTLPVHQLAQTAYHLFQTRQYPKCIDCLRKVQELIGNEEDFRIAHNIAIVTYYIGGCKEPFKLLETLSRLEKKRSQQLQPQPQQPQQRLKANSLPTEANEEACTEETIDDISSAIVEYNQAVLYFQMKKYSTASILLESIFSRIDSIDESLGLHASFLLLDTYLMMGSSEKANNIINYLEKTLPSVMKKAETEKRMAASPRKGGSWDKNEDFNGVHGTSGEEGPSLELFSGVELKALLHLYKAKLQLLEKSTQGAKRNIKFAMSGGQSAPAILLKSNIEYLRDNVSKATKLLNAIHKSADSKVATLSPLYYNNLGCVHFKQKKLNAALFYFNKALKENEELNISGK